MVHVRDNVHLIVYFGKRFELRDITKIKSPQAYAKGEEDEGVLATF
jgi:hypothetical protein